MTLTLILEILAFAAVALLVSRLIAEPWKGRAYSALKPGPSPVRGECPG